MIGISRSVESLTGCVMYIPKVILNYCEIANLQMYLYTVDNLTYMFCVKI